jgi:hypothetical protein
MAALDKAAAETGESKAHIVENALQEYLERIKKEV